MRKRIIHTFFFICFLGKIIAQSPSIGGYNVYYGHLHNHNAIGTSYAVGSHDDAYNFARNVAGLDYFSTSNHWIYMTDPAWDSIKMVADKYNEDGVFTTFWGFEYESIGGDLTIVNTEDYSTVSDPICSWLESQNGVAFINHPYGAHYGLIENSPPCDRIVGMELFNKTDGFDVYFYPVIYFNDANIRGWKIGASGSDDNYKGTWGQRTDWRMAILSKHLSRPELFEAMRARRFYSTLDKDLALSFKIDSVEMGSTIGSGFRRVQIQASDDLGDPFTRVILYKDGIEYYKWEDSHTSFVDLTKPIDAYAGEFYYVKVTQADGDEAISSPIYITHNPVCSLTSPPRSIHYSSPEVITIKADASDADGTVERVEFFINGSYIGSDTIMGPDTLQPYSIDYAIPGDGLYEITAKVKDDLGNWGTSSSSFFTTGNYSNSLSYKIENSEDDQSVYGCYKLFCSVDSVLLLGYYTGTGVQSRLRFTNLYIPPGINIESAYVQFTTKEVETQDCLLFISGSWYGTTSAEVIWEPPAWRNVGAAGPDQRTPDLSSIIQEIVNHPEYTINSTITIIFTGVGFGQRSAVTYENTQEDPDKFAGAEAKLTVNYNTFPRISSVFTPGYNGTDLRLYPNPARDLLTVETNSREQHSVEITSLNGQLLYSTRMEEPTHRIDLSSFRKGIYIITVRSRDYVRTGKIIKL